MSLHTGAYRTNNETMITASASASTLMPPPSGMPIPIRKRETSSPADDDDQEEEEEEEYRPGPSERKRPIAPRPSGTGSRGSTKSSREALRKANHSLIERRRREKINFALGELREMVPGLGDEKGGKAGEFKLEVLERTVIHMRDLKAQIAKLEDRVVRLRGEKLKQGASPACDCSEEDEEIKTRLEPSSSSKRKYEDVSTTPPSPSSSPDRRSPRPLLNGRSNGNQSGSPDPNETDAETNLPPPLTVASRTSSTTSSSSSHPSITSILNSATATATATANANANRQQPPPPQPSSRPAPPPQANNPTLYLPFPTPSPTSPFLTYPSATSASSGSIEPSPFMAPLQNFSLFGGAISLDPTVSPEVKSYHRVKEFDSGSGSRSPPELSMPPPKSTRGKDKDKAIPSSEEAANLLLAFSSPDTLRPVSGGTPVFAASGPPHRRGTLDSEDFTLDGEYAAGTRRKESNGYWSRPPIAGKTARDILRM